MTTATVDRTSLRRNVNCSRWLTELRQRADRKLADWDASGLGGGKKQALEACQAVMDQARAEGRTELAEEYEGKRVKLQH